MKKTHLSTLGMKEYSFLNKNNKGDISVLEVLIPRARILPGLVVGARLCLFLLKETIASLVLTVFAKTWKRNFKTMRMNTGNV
jgi:hypothetical protein